METKESGLTWFDRVRSYFPNATEEQCEELLWNCTPFPCGNAEQVEGALRAAHVAGGGTVAGALRFGDQAMREAMDSMLSRENLPVPTA